VVDVPRAARADERESLDPAVVAEMDAAFEAVPPLRVGDRVTVTGTWATVSPKGFRHTDGLLVFKAMRILTGASEAK
jgi:hypothetical protein